MHFFETLVRIHRAGEGAPYTGLKPAGRDLGPAIPAADKALESGSSEQLVKLLTDTVRNGVHERFKDVIAKKSYDPNNAGASDLTTIEPGYGYWIKATMDTTWTLP